MKKRLLLLSTLLSFGAMSTISADEVKMQVYQTGEEAPWEILLGDISKLTFEEANLTVFGQEEAVTLKAFELQNLEKLTFTGLKEGIFELGNATEKINFKRQGDLIEIQGATSEMELYTISGKRLPIHLEGTNVHIQSLSPGVYLLKAGQSVYKFSK